ncbi:murein transglycosylase [Zhengella mangrovi]|uniref:Murein transglycosylase n=1 Tax=Zhengella mangrovi TaxID=1982044 RepID=A0A2G1QQR9_9HYPH|nr:transglycosylase SLT domain-containing protein [Zhengella mangrovi]PHP67810.1 murein transglycosylase [Zhengella mangrovi]
MVLFAAISPANAESDRAGASYYRHKVAVDRSIKTGSVKHVTKESTHTVSAGYAKPVTGRKYSSLINQYAAKYGVPSQLAHAVIRVESNYRANARGSAGEIGLMQVKPSTARMMGYSGSAKGLYHPETNIKFGMKYLAMAHKLGGGSVCGTILKYNAGHGAKRMNPVSARYCAKVKRYM